MENNNNINNNNNEFNNTQTAGLNTQTCGLKALIRKYDKVARSAYYGLVTYDELGLEELKAHILDGMAIYDNREELERLEVDTSFCSNIVCCGFGPYDKEMYQSRNLIGSLIDKFDLSTYLDINQSRAMMALMSKYQELSVEKTIAKAVTEEGRDATPEELREAKNYGAKHMKNFTTDCYKNKKTGLDYNNKPSLIAYGGYCRWFKD